MTPAEVVAQALRCFNDRHRDGWIALAAHDVTVGGQPDLWTSAYDIWLDAIPDEQFSIVSMIENDRGEVACEIRVTGTHSGPVNLPRTPNKPDLSNTVEIPATEKHVDYTYAGFWRIKDGQIAAVQIYGRVSGMAEQLGALSFAPSEKPV